MKKIPANTYIDLLTDQMQRLGKRADGSTPKWVLAAMGLAKKAQLHLDRNPKGGTEVETQDEDA